MLRCLRRLCGIGLLIVSVGCLPVVTPEAANTTVPSPTPDTATRKPTIIPRMTYTPRPTMVPRPTRPPTATPLPDLSLEQLRNATYPSDLAESGEARLVDGSFKVVNDPGGIAEGSIALADMVSFGDLDDDGIDDAAVMLVEADEVAPPALSLAIVVNRGGRPVAVAVLALGDDVVPRSMTVCAGRVTLDLMQYGPHDALGYPSRDSRRVYEFSDGELTLLTAWDGPRQQAVFAPTMPTMWMPFAPGTDATLVNGSLLPLGDQVYLLEGRDGQDLELAVASPYDQVVLSVRGLADGLVLTSVLSNTVRWSGKLPVTQLYAITLSSLAGNATPYTLAVRVTPTPVLTPTPTLTEAPTPLSALTSTVALTATGSVTTTLPLSVTVTPTDAPLSHVPAGSRVYLTFDVVSNSSEALNGVLDVLAEYGAEAAFFLSGSATGETSVAASLLQTAGHTVGTLAVSELSLTQGARDAYLTAVAESRRSQGLAWACVRPPYSALDAVTRTALAERGYGIALWDIDAATWPGKDVVSIASAMLREAAPGVVIRFTVGAPGMDSAALLEELLPVLRAEGYGFGGVSPDW